jgi:hypothetical protein
MVEAGALPGIVIDAADAVLGRSEPTIGGTPVSQAQSR